MAAFKNDGTIYLMYYSQDDIATPIASKTFIGGTWEEIFEQNPFADVWYDNKKYSEWSYSYMGTVSASNDNLENLINTYGVKSGIDTWELRVYAKKEGMPVLTYEGVQALWKQIDLKDYPNNETLMAVIDAIDKTKANKDEIIQADWNQTDENKLDYIKNKPFGAEIGKIYLIEEQTVTLDSNGRGNCIPIDNFWEYVYPFLGSAYEVEFDGEVYTGTIYEDGDMCVRTDFTTSSGVEVYMYDGSSIDSSSALAGDHTIKLSVIGENVTQIDDKYINFPVKSVNGKTGIVWLNPNDIGAANVHDLKLKMDKENPTGTGSFSLNRKAGSTKGQYSFAEGYNTTASGKNSHAEGEITTASYNSSHAEGYNTTASGYASHAEGDSTKASSSNSHAEGYKTEASNYASHAEGYKTKSSGRGAHAEGYVPDGGTGETITVDGKSYNKFTLLAEGTGSHAEGCATIAYGDYSHTQGQYTFAYGECSNVQGKYNVIDTENKYAHIVGNGNTSTATRSNAHTLDWNGNAWYQGTIKLGGTSYNDASEIALKSDVENKKNKDIVLTLSWTTAEDGTRTYSVDKTFEEIKEAYNSGTSLYVNASGIKFKCTKVSNTTAWFDYYLPLGMIEHNILVKSDNTVTWTSKTRSAQASICGGVKADKKSDTDTVPAKIGEDGKLYVPTYPTLDGLASEDYVNENIEITKTELDAVKKNVNTFINDPYKILRDLAIISTGGVEITDLSLYETNYGFIGNAGTWININEKYQYVIIPITSKGAKLQVTALEDAVFYFAGLRSFDSTPSVNDTPDYSTAEGWTGRRTGSMGNTHSYQIPDDVKYLYVNVVYNTKPVYTTDFKLTIPESDGRINILEKKVEALEQGTTLPQETIKWIALGDSITEGFYSIHNENTEDTENHKDTTKSYCAWVARQKGFELTNKGVGGSGWLKRGTTAAPKLNAREQIDAVNEDGSYVLDFTQFDLCTIMWGVNDWKGGELLGTFDDGLNPETESVISNMRYVIETILTRNPEIKLIIITPVNCRQDTLARPSTAENNWGIGFTFGSGENKKTLQDYYNAIKQVCDYYGVEMIDMLHNSVINRINAETLLPDKVHPSLEAHRKMGLDLAGKILFGN